MPASYVRCGHCRGFYELALSHCRYCGKDVPVKDGAGRAKVFPDRETCRAIQIAEFEQLPAEAHEDPFQPDPELLERLCYCLHCGPDGLPFEAVEMRWIVNEGMWACPCTTCGGRGFTFDVHLLEPLWQCAECQHWYAPADGNRKASNAKCPKCGSTMANGWFDDESDSEEMTEEEVKDYEEFTRKFEAEHPRPPVVEKKPDEDLPWADDDTESPFGTGPVEMEKMADDIDFPRSKAERPKLDEDGEDSDIPY